MSTHNLSLLCHMQAKQLIQSKEMELRERVIFWALTLLGYWLLLLANGATWLLLGRRSNRSQLGIGLEEVPLQFGKDMFSVGVLLEGGDVRPDLVHEDLPLIGLRHVNHLLDHVIGVLILHHDVQGAVGTVKINARNN